MSNDYRKLAQQHDLDYDDLIANGFTNDEIKWYADSQTDTQTVPDEQNDPIRRLSTIDKDAPDFVPGVLRGIDQTQAMGYGAGALVGKGLKSLGAEDLGQKVQDWGLEGYRRNLAEAGENAKKYSFKDVYTGKAGVGGAIDWAQGTLGELVPSMAEAAIGAVIGSVTGSVVGPGGTVAGLGIGAFAGRTLLKKAIDKGVKQAVKKGIGKVSEGALRKAITKQALKKLGGKIGMGAAVMPLETGGMYASLLEEQGIDAPGTALFFGALSTSLEYLGGNSRLIDTFIDALGSGKGIAKKTAKELLTNIPQEALQEGGQEVTGILNEIVNTKGDFITAEHIESIIESMGAGAIGGGAGAVVSSGMNSQSTQSDYDKNITEKFDNILSQGAEKVPASIDALNQKIIKNSQLIQQKETLASLATEADMEVADLEQFLLQDNKANQELLTRLEEVAPGQAVQADQTQQEIVLDQNNIQSIRRQNDSPFVATPQTPDNAKQAMDEELFGTVTTDNADGTAQASAEVFAQQPEILNEDGQPFQTYDELAAQIAVLPNASEYKIIQTQEGFIGVKKVSSERTSSAFKSEPQVDQVAQVEQEGIDNDKITLEEDLNRQGELVPQTTQTTLRDATGATRGQPTTAPTGQTPQAQQDMANLEEQLQVNTQQLDALVTQLKATTDPQERLALQQEGAVIYETKAKLQAQWDAKYQEQLQSQGTLAEPNAENASFLPSLQTTDQQTSSQLALPEIESMFPNQKVTQADDGTINVRFKNGKGVTIKSIQDAGQGFIKLAIETGQMSEKGKILGITIDNDILLDANFADNKTMWHENKHVLDNLGMVTKEDDSALNAEFNKLRKAGKLGFALSTHENPVQRMKENRANMFAQVMTARAAYRGNSKFKTMIQRVMDFFQQMLKYGQQSISGLAREVETGALYERQDTENTTDDVKDQTQFQATDMGYSVTDQVLAGLITKKTETDTPEFAEWFGKSTAKTQEGAPLIFYHGTDGVFDTFRQDASNQTGHASAGLGHFFTLQKSLAGKYGQHVLPVYLKMDKPYLMALPEAQSFKTVEESTKRQEELKAEGYDSILIKTGDSPYIVIFESVQAKSIHNQGQWKDPKNIYFETREQAVQTDQPEQKLTDAQYDKSFNQKNNIIQNILQTTRIRGNDLKLLADKSFGAISTRLGNANVMLKHKMRRLDFDTSQKIIEALHVAKPLLDATKDMSTQDKHAWDLARKQADAGKIKQIATKYNMLEDQEKLRIVMNKLRQDAIDVGYQVGFIDEYWPRVIKDTEGFLQAFYEDKTLSNRPIFTDAISAKAKKMGITVEALNRDFPEVKADIISNMLLGQGSGMGGPGNIQSRKFETIPEGFEKFYMNSDSALMQYIYSMTKKIEARKFFGKVPPKIQAHKNAITKAQINLNEVTLSLGQTQDNAEVTKLLQDRADELNDQITLHNEALDKYKEQRDYTENIGAYIDELMLSGNLHKKDEKVVKEILNARFNEHGTTGVVNAYKNLAYIDVMGNVVSAMTQIADLVWGAYVGKVWTPRGFSNTVQNTIAATLGKSKMTKEALGLERIAQEFADGTTLGNAVSKVFTVVGLTKMDSIGKEVLINNALMNYQEQIKTDSGRKALAKEISPIFGKETNQVITDLGTGEHSDNVKMLVYSKVLDFQPVALSEMPEFYLSGGNGRIFYMLKTYTLKQLDVFRNEIGKEITSGDPKQVAQGMKNMVALISLLTLANAGVDELKDLVMGRETRFKDNVIENFLTLGGASRYMQMQVTREGVGAALAQKILPPFKFINAISSDLREKIVTGDIEKGLRSVESIPSFGPVGGKLWYWHYGRGSQTKKTLNEKDFSEANKRFKKFKKQLEKSSDKRLFLQSNIDEFKQMKLHQNFSSALNGNKATINKLKKLKQTPNVIKRIDQLEKQRKLFYDKYFISAKNLK